MVSPLHSVENISQASLSDPYEFGKQYAEALKPLVDQGLISEAGFEQVVRILYVLGSASGNTEFLNMAQGSLHTTDSGPVDSFLVELKELQ